VAPTSRSIAATALLHVVANGKTLDTVLASELNRLADPRDRAFAQELAYGVVRWYWNLLPQLQGLLHRRLRQRDREIEMLLLVGLYQLQHLSTPVHAAVAATVAACDAVNRSWAKGLVNATLRTAIRRGDDLAKETANTISARTGHPDWFISALQTDWPDTWDAVLTANNQHPPLTLRVNQQRYSREQYLDLLSKAEIDAHKSHFSKHGIRLDQAVPVDALPEFDSGGVSVQDEAAQLATTVLDLPDGGYVLDACAAPGGKTAHILETSGDQIKMVAIDRVEHRVELLKETLQRLALDAQIHICDATNVDQWWDGTLFDRILLDAPCSGSGVIRRHPDIKIHRRAEDIPQLAKVQGHILNSLWPLLKPGGKLVYATCSILRAENDGVISKFVAGPNRIVLDRITGDWGHVTECGRQIITGDDHMDGFYYARLIKE
jgi:16S rRNA (cytosine967-C5)-methyltransferase